MDLRRYLFEYRITQRKFAEMIDYNRCYVSMIAKGQRPGAKAARAIEKATNGLVSYPKDKEENTDE